MKLHLGCGQIYLPGYLNIDFPLSNHSVQKRSVADQYADITKLKYPRSSVTEIRLHHVFEHFDRATACALLISWYNWLKPSGVLHIEVPDFSRSAAAALNPLTSNQKRHIALRHLFGSQEAVWATHYHGWTRAEFTQLLTLIGYQKIKYTSSSWRGTYNLTVKAYRAKHDLKRTDAITLCDRWLSLFQVDDTPGEKQLHKYWLGISKKQLTRSFST